MFMKEMKLLLLELKSWSLEKSKEINMESLSPENLEESDVVL